MCIPHFVGTSSMMSYSFTEMLSVEKKFHASYRIKFFVLCDFTEAPIFTSSIRQETLGEYGAIVKLPCEAMGVPKPVIMWYKNAVEISKLGDHNR